jgi:hypothetical protein
MSDVEALAERLEAIVADLDDLAFERLREAVAAGATARPQSDKEITKARRAAEKAAHILRRLADAPDDEPVD